MPGVSSLCQRSVNQSFVNIKDMKPTFVIVYRLEHLLGCYEEMGHFPHRHLEVHLREFE